MPIRINLLAEVQAAEEARRRDPVKRAMLVAGTLIALMLVWGGIEFSKASVSKAKYQELDKEWKKNQPQFEEVDKNEKQKDALQRKLDSLARLSTNRFLWGTVLSSFQQASVDQVQFIRFNGINAYTPVDPVPARKTEKGTMIPGKPGQSKETITILVEAKDFGSQTDQSFEKLKKAIFATPYFKSLLPPDAIKLKSQSFQPQLDPVENKQYTTFTLECNVPPRTFVDQ